MNKPGWPYIGPVVRNNDNKVRVVCECICISESMEIYELIILSMEDMEPEYSRSNIRIIYADQHMTPQLLHNLGITDTCVLHGDYWHLLNIVFPDVFSGYFDQLHSYLNEMLTCSSVTEWKTAYEGAEKYT